MSFPPESYDSFLANIRDITYMTFKDKKPQRTALLHVLTCVVTNEVDCTINLGWK